MGKHQHVWKHIRNCVLGAPALIAFALKWLFKRILAKRKLPSVVIKNKANIYHLHFDAEQAPNRLSRVYLGDEVDAFGQPRLVADWSFTDQDARSVLECIKIIASELERTGTGQMKINEQAMLDRIRETGVGSHHIGLTRMANDPTEGVVDKDCRVFGIDNLYIASSSTFPTASFANPTLTIIAFALRIADQLKRCADLSADSSPKLSVSL